MICPFINQKNKTFSISLSKYSTSDMGQNSITKLLIIYKAWKIKCGGRYPATLNKVGVSFGTRGGNVCRVAKAASATVFNAPCSCEIKIFLGKEERRLFIFKALLRTLLWQGNRENLWVAKVINHGKGVGQVNKYHTGKQTLMNEGITNSHFL